MRSYSSARSGFASLMGGIITDVKDLLVHELTLAKLEMRDEVRQTKSAAASFAVGFGIAMIGLVLTFIMFVHLLHQYSKWPMWSCYGILGVSAVVIGGIILRVSVRRSEDVAMIPDRSIENFKETVDWIKENATSGRLS
ncbi:MAG: phage holin family protein [Candidatus Binatia bacterium]